MSSGATDDPRPEAIDASPSQIDATLDSFEELEQIGAGGNADVSKAAYHGDGPDVCAVKQPRIQGTLSSDSIDEFTAEAETWEKLDDHDHIVGVLDHGQAPLPWIALEYMDGGSLEDRLDDIETAEALWTGVCVARAVRHAHRRGIAHLDLKPENVLFTTTDGRWDVPKVTDWGLAKMLLDHSQSVQGLSPHYAAPEQFDAEAYGHPDDYTDIYAVGAVVYAALVGEPPFTGSAAGVMRDVLEAEPTPPSERVDGLPEGTDDVIMQALAKDKDDRYESILDLRRELETLVDRALGTPSSESESSPAQATDSHSRSTADIAGGRSDPQPRTAATGTGSAEPETQHSGTPSQPSTQSADVTTDERSAPSDSTTDVQFDSGRYLYASLLFIPLGGIFGAALSDALGGLCIMGGFAASIYYWNQDMKNIQNSKRTTWSPRRYLYFGGVMFYGISILVYLYRRKNTIGLT